MFLIGALIFIKTTIESMYIIGKAGRCGVGGWAEWMIPLLLQYYYHLHSSLYLNNDVITTITTTYIESM